MASFIQDIDEIRRRAAEKIEEGAVTKSYKGDSEKTVSILNDALATEIVCVLRYMHHYFMATGVHGKSVADEFKEHADSEREHADWIAERIQQLGGKPDFNPGTLVKRSSTQYIEGQSLAAMIREDLIAERTVIEVYQEMIRYFGSNDPTTRRLIEKILADEEEHASDLSDLLYITDPQTGETEGKDPAADSKSVEKQNGHSRGESKSEKPHGSDADSGPRTVTISATGAPTSGKESGTPKPVGQDDAGERMTLAGDDDAADAKSAGLAKSSKTTSQRFDQSAKKVAAKWKGAKPKRRAS